MSPTVCQHWHIIKREKNIVTKDNSALGRDRIQWIKKNTATWQVIFSNFVEEVFGSVQRPENREEESPQSLLRQCWDTRVGTRVSAAPARLSDPASYWRSASAGTDSSCRRCNAYQLSGLDRRRRIPLRTEVHLYPLRSKNLTVRNSRVTVWI